MKINVLSLFSGIGGIKMGFSLEKKKSTDVPMHRAEAPMELWNKHRGRLKDHQHIYTDFTCENADKDWIVSVNIAKSRKFGLHYLRARNSSSYLQIKYRMLFFILDYNRINRMFLM